MHPADSHSGHPKVQEYAKKLRPYLNLRFSVLTPSGVQTIRVDFVLICIRYNGILFTIDTPISLWNKDLQSIACDYDKEECPKHKRT